jgi:hypothetical protein
MVKNQPEVLREGTDVGRATAIVVVIGMMLVAGAALGQAVAPPPGGPITAPPSGAALAPGGAAVRAPASGESVLFPDLAELQISPRAWFLFESFGSPRTQSPQNFKTNASDDYMLGGASVSARFNSLPETTFVLTGLYGTNAPRRAQNQSVFFSSSQSDGVTGFSNTSSEIATTTKRLDLEFLGVTAIPDTSWAWIAGARFEHHESDNVGTQFTNTNVSVSPCVAPFAPNCSFTSSSSVPVSGQGSLSVYTVKGGLGGALPLTADGRVSLFGNMMGLIGFATRSDGVPDFGVFGPDGSVGLQYRFSPTITADFRYRAIVYFLFSKQPSDPSYVVYQGPMIGVNFKF